MFLSQDKVRTAQGEATFDIKSCKVAIANREFEIPVFAGDEIREILLGSQWLKIFKLTADYANNIVTLV